MKKLITFLLLLTLSITSFGQPTNTTSLPKTDYLQRSKNQKTAARILLYGGASCIAIGFLIPDADSGFIFPDNFGVKVAFIFSGFLSTLISLPIFTASSRNKWKAKEANAFLKMETAPVYQGYSMTSISYPALSVKINLR